MRPISRRAMLAAPVGLLAASRVVHAQPVKPRLTLISQWSTGSDGAAITALGKKFEERGGIWQHSPVPGFTTDMMNKLRAQIMAGDPPACSQLKGQDIAAWSKIAPTVSLDQVVAAKGYEKVVAPDLIKIHKPFGHWIALPLQVYRTNTMFYSKRAMDRAKATKIPTNLEEFNALAEQMVAAGIAHPFANGGLRFDDGMKFETSLCAINPATYRAAVMELDDKALRSKDVHDAFVQVRKLANWLDPNVATQHYSVFLPRFISGDMGILLSGGWAQGVMLNAGYKLDDFILAPGPTENGKPVFILNADAFIFWQRKEADLQAGQMLFADCAMEPANQVMYSHITGSIPVRTDVDLSGPDFTDGQREAAKTLKEAIAVNQVVLSLAHNMAQPNDMTAAMLDAIGEYVHDRSQTPELGQERLIAAIDSAR